MSIVLPEECRRFVELFNRHEYFEAHETLEQLWRRTRDDDRSFYQGLIQASVALYHYRRGNHSGARTLLRRSAERLRPYEPVHRGLDVTRLRLDLEAFFAPLLEGREDQSDVSGAPTIEWVDAG